MTKNKLKEKFSNLFSKLKRQMQPKVLLPKLKRELKLDFEVAKELLGRKMSVASVSAILSAYTMVAFNYPFFSYISENTSNDSNGIWIVFSVYILMFVLNYLVYYVLLFFGRVVGKSIIALTLVGNAICLYFINSYNTLIDMTMMGNVFNTRYSEASSFFSYTMLWYALLLGVIPCIFLFRKKIDYGPIWKFLLSVVASIAILIGILFSHTKNTFWIDYHAPIMGSKILPWSYTINSIRYYNYWKLMNQKEVIQPDAEIVTDTKDIVVLIIGESARSKNFSLYGYDKETNPLLKNDGVVALRARASDTYTLSAVRAILQHKQREGVLYEILPNYLYRNGVDVIWRSSNWGTPRIKVEKNYSIEQLQDKYPEADGRFDGILFHRLGEEIAACTKDKIFVGIHTYTSHGPRYYSNTPSSIKKFYPECRTVEVNKSSYTALLNAYDNTIVYTDYLVHSVIETLRTQFPNRRSCVIFISDHGESLGERGNYMHGTPKRMAPPEQLDIPFIVWVSDNAGTKVKEVSSPGHHNIYHSVLHFLGLQTPIYNESKNIFE
jgi:lipid A ethanolaminephosphotransferase